MITEQAQIGEFPRALQSIADRAEIAISVRGVGKMYRIYDRPQDRLKQMLRRGHHMYGHEFWALRNISFEVKRGETVGIIGRNGSGKSTLLQIIAGTLTPTEGEVVVNGRVAALLELGSGFNPEFTGRENVFLNGAILGFSREEMDKLFDKIAVFADIGEFIEQPVKMYSSGMVVRLAFAVQVFISKEILIVDEALAVGDEAFQRKCMASIKAFQEGGGTVLLVTHDTQTIVRHCNRCVLLAHGKVIVVDESKLVCDLYQKLMYSDSQTVQQIVTVIQQQGLRNALGTTLEEPNSALLEPQSHKEPLVDWLDPNIPKTSEVTYGNGDAEITDFKVLDQYSKQVNVLTTGRRYIFTYQVHFRKEARDVHFGIMLKTIDGLDVAGISSNLERLEFKQVPVGSIVKMTFSIKLNLVPGTYFMNAGVGAHLNGEYAYLHRRVDMCMIKVLSPDGRDIYGVAYLEPQLTAEFVTDVT